MKTDVKKISWILSLLFLIGCLILLIFFVVFKFADIDGATRICDEKVVVHIITDIVSRESGNYYGTCIYDTSKGKISVSGRYHENNLCDLQIGELIYWAEPVRTGGCRAWRNGEFTLVVEGIVGTGGTTGMKLPRSKTIIFE